MYQRSNQKELESRIRALKQEVLQLKNENERYNKEFQKELILYKKAEEALRENEATLRSLFRAAPAGISMMVNRVIRQANDRFCEMVGYCRDELIGENIRLLYFTDADYEYVGQEKYAQISARGTGTMETRWRHKDGAIIDILINSAPIDPDDLSRGVTITALDITERKNTEKKLSYELSIQTALSKLYGPLISSSSTINDIALIILEQALFLTDSQDGYVSSIDPQTEENVAHTLTEMLKHQCKVTEAKQGIVFPKAKDGRYHGLWGHTLNVKKAFYTNDPLIHPASTGLPDDHIPIERFLSVPVMSGKELVGQIALANKKMDYHDRDLSAVQRLAEYYALAVKHNRSRDALRESEERFRVLFEGAPDAIILADPNTGQIIDANPAASMMLLRSHDEILSLNQSQLHPPGSELYSKTTFQEHVQRARFNMPSTPIENVFLRSDGSTIPIEVTAQMIYLNGRPLLQGYFRDITKRKQAEEKRLHLEGQLQQTQKMKAIASLAGGIAHEFNNALSTISGNIDLLEMELPEKEEIQSRIKPMKYSTQRMARLTNQLLAYARGGKYQPKTISLSTFIEETLPILRHNIHKGIRVETDLPHDILRVEVDTIQLQMVLTALISNASEAIDRKGRIRIILRNQEVDDTFIKDHPTLFPGSYACLTVQDDGKGMDETTRANIFTPFFSTKYQGRGLSMAAVYGIVKNHNGWISIDSEPGKGTSVKIYLPASQEPIRDLPDRKKKIVKGSGNILLIEDEGPVMDVTREFLDMMGYHVICAKTGKEAVHLARTFDGNIALAVLDMIMPDMAAKDVYASLLESRPQLKVLICSGYSLDGPAQVLLDQGADGFIQKPFSIVELSEKISGMLKNS
ncbi:MAG: PAS domain S-box protein [Deltaproteobacteria bacterium]|nr:PAS domain S-box protein [Deltaproteobacteria bacterium]